MAWRLSNPSRAHLAAFPPVAAAAAVPAGTERPCAAVSVKSTSLVTERKNGPVWPGAYVAGTIKKGSSDLSSFE